MLKPYCVRCAQRGFTVIELLVVIAILAIGAVVASQRAVDSFLNSKADQAADDIVVVGKAIQAYIPGNIATLSAAPATLVSTNTLITAGFLPANWATGNPWGSNYNIRVRRIGAAAPYQYEALVITTARWQIDGEDQIARLGRAVQRIGGPGGLTYDASGAVGSGGAWSAPVADYPQANASAKLAYFVSQATTPFDSIYLRLDGSNAMAADLNMGGNGIVAANEVNATGPAMNWRVTTAGAYTGASTNVTGSVTAGTTVNAGTNVNAGNNVLATNIVRGATVNSLGNISMGAGGSLTSTGSITIAPTGALTLDASGGTTVAGSGALTVQDTVTVTNDVNITTMTTRAGGGINAPTTTSLKTLAPRLVEMANYVITAHGQTLPAPVCINGGVREAFILPHIGTGVATAGTWGYEVRLNGPNAANNYVAVARDASGAAITAAPPAGSRVENFAAIVRTFCRYGVL